MITRQLDQLFLPLRLESLADGMAERTRDDEQVQHEEMLQYEMKLTNVLETELQKLGGCVTLAYEEPQRHFRRSMA